MTVESARRLLSFSVSSFYDTLTLLLQSLQHLCFLNAQNGTFNMTWQTKQINQRISRSRQPDQTNAQPKSSWFYDLQTEGRKSGGKPVLSFWISVLLDRQEANLTWMASNTLKVLECLSTGAVLFVGSQSMITSLTCQHLHTVFLAYPSTYLTLFV